MTDADILDALGRADYENLLPDFSVKHPWSKFDADQKAHYSDRVAHLVPVIRQLIAEEKP